MAETQPISEAFLAVMDLAEARGIRRINELPGCWELALDESWWIAVNGHREATACSRGTVKVPPFACYVEFNGWPVGLFTPAGGTIAAGDCANEDELIAAIKRAAEAS